MDYVLVAATLPLTRKGRATEFWSCIILQGMLSLSCWIVLGA